MLCNTYKYKVFGIEAARLPPSIVNSYNDYSKRHVVTCNVIINCCVTSELIQVIGLLWPEYHPQWNNTPIPFVEVEKSLNVIYL